MVSIALAQAWAYPISPSILPYNLTLSCGAPWMAMVCSGFPIPNTGFNPNIFMGAPMAETGASGVVAGLLSSLRSPGSGDVETSFYRLDCDDAESSPVVMVDGTTAGGQFSSVDGAPSLSEVWHCCISSAAFHLRLDSGVITPCLTLAIFFCNFLAWLINCSSLLCRVANVCSSSELCSVV